MVTIENQQPINRVDPLGKAKLMFFKLASLVTNRLSKATLSDSVVMMDTSVSTVYNRTWEKVLNTTLQSQVHTIEDSPRPKTMQDSYLFWKYFAKHRNSYPDGSIASNLGLLPIEASWVIDEALQDLQPIGVNGLHLGSSVDVPKYLTQKN